MLTVTLLLSTSGCKGRAGTLQPPRGAEAWSAEYSRFFDDGLTELPVALTGRAPNDVRDQRRFGMRLGYSDLVVLATVQQSWSQGLSDRRQKHFVEVDLQRVLLERERVQLPEEQTLRIERNRPLPPSIRGAQMILFIRWAPGEQPPFHHHLVLASDEMVETIDAMVEHAKREGQLGSAAERRRARRAKKTEDPEGDPGPEDEEVEDIDPEEAGASAGAEDAVEQANPPAAEPVDVDA